MTPTRPTPAILALDIGTSSCKGAIYSSGGDRLVTTTRAYDLSHPQPSFVEQSPDDYLRAAREVARDLASRAAALRFEVAAISFSTQTPTLVFCDLAGVPVRPAIIWQDSRASREAELLSTRYSDTQRRRWFGMDLPVAAASTPAKLLWVQHHEPETWRRTRWVVQPKDYVALALTGGPPVTDAWCAKGIANLETGRMDDEFQTLLDKAESVCPPILAATAQAGSVTGGSAREWGLPAGVPVLVGWSDALAGILSTGACATPSRGFVITGTSEIIGVSKPRGTDTHPGLFRVPAHLLPLPELQLNFGPTQAGGSALDWLARIMSRTTGEILDLLPNESQPSPVLFRPYLAGERAPYWDHSLTGSFEGLRFVHGPADLVQAVVQGIALQERLVLSCAETGVPATDVVIAGGAARHRNWNLVRAHILQRPLLEMRDLEASLRGAALIGWAGLGAFDLRSPPDAWFAADRLEPSPAWADNSREMMDRFVLPGR